MIGIISYLPDFCYEIRFNRLNRLLSQLRQLFPKEKILIIAQNWRNSELSQITLNHNIILKSYKTRLGIVNARNICRKFLLESSDNYFILYDDDSELVWDKNITAEVVGNTFIEAFFKSKYGILWDTPTMIKNLIIGRNLLEQIPFRSGFADLDYFEDAAFYEDTVNYFLQRDNIYYFADCQNIIKDVSSCGGEPYRTWSEWDKINKIKGI